MASGQRTSGKAVGGGGGVRAEGQGAVYGGEAGAEGGAKTGTAMISSEEELFRKRLSFLTGFVSDVESQLGVLEGLEEVAEKTTDDTLNAILQTITPAIKDRLILCAAQILDQNSGTNLQTLLGHYKANRKRIKHVGEPLADAVLDQLISADHLPHKKIRKLRDKALAHLDRQFTDDPDAFLAEVGLSFEKDIFDVVNHAQRVLAQLSLSVDQTARMSVGKVFWASTVEHFRREGKLK